MKEKRSRTTKKAAALLPGDHVIVAVPASEDGRQVILAITNDASASFSARSDNPGLPHLVEDRFDERPTILESTNESVTLGVAGRTFHVARLHRMSTIRALETPDASASIDGSSPDAQDNEGDEDPGSRPDRSVFGNKTTTLAKKLEPAADILHAVPAVDEDGTAVIVALGASSTALFEPSKRNAARPKALRQVLTGPRSFEPEGRSGGTLRVSERAFEIGRLHRRGVETFLALPDPATDLAPPEDSKWATVARAFVEELKLPAELLDAKVDDRSRTTIQCQRLLPEHHVTLAVPVTPTGTTDLKGAHVVALTTGGPFLFRSSRGNPALPRDLVGLVEDASPISFSPHDREGGVLALGAQEFLVPVAYGRTVRDLILAMADAEA